MGGALFIPSAFTDLVDCPSAIQALKAVRGNAAGTALEFYTPSVGGGSCVLGTDLLNVVDDFGADPTGTSDSSSAFQSAADSGAIIYIPLGTYKKSLETVLNVAGTGFIGPYWADAVTRKSGCIVYVDSTTANGFRLAASDTFLAGFSIRIDPARTPTAGTGIVIGEVGGAVTTRQSVHNMSCLGLYDCILVGDVWGVYINNFAATMALRYNMQVKQRIPYGACKFTNIATGSAKVANIAIFGGEFNLWTNIAAGAPGADNSAIGILLESSYNDIRHQIFNGIYCDDIPAAGCGIKLVKGAYTNRMNNFIGGTTPGAGGGPGVIVGVGCEGNIFSDLHALVATSATAFEDNGNYTNIKDCKIGLHVGTSTYTGIKLGATSTGALISGNTVKARKYGIEIASGASYATITSNDFRGNNTANALIAAGVKATSIIKDNQGLVDYENSVSGTPDFIGQRAYVGGHEYVAVGTSSSADWKQTTA